MKKFYLFISLLTFNVIFSQDWTPISGVSSGIIDEGSTSTAPSPLVTNSYHDTQGQLDVSASGEVNFNFPIAIPPGIKSVAPQINLIYSGNSFSGIAGIGWNTSGLSSISRVGKNIEKDGAIQGLKYDYTDFYQFNGQRLILTSGEYGKPNATYTTQQFSNLKIKSVGTCTIPNTLGPEGFEITFEDGSQAIYGMVTDSFNHHEYNITKWIDPHGNYISYNYAKSNNSIVISNIEWGGNLVKQTSYFNKIDFYYKERNIKQFAYSNGIKSVQDKILDRITVHNYSTLFREYKLNHTSPPSGINNQIVDKIEESVLGESANEINFYRNLENENMLSAETATYNLGTLDSDKTVKGDFDGDGKIDILSFIPYTTGFYIPSPICSTCGTWIPYNPPIQAQTQLKLSGLDTNYSVLNVSSYDLTKQALTANVLSQTGKTKQKQALINYKEMSGNLRIETFFLENNLMQLEYVKVIASSHYDNSFVEPHTGPFEQYIERNDYLNSIKEIDIDSDGISELVLVIKSITTRHNEPKPDCPENGGGSSRPGECIITIIDPPQYYYYLLNPNPSDFQATYPISGGFSQDILSTGHFTDLDGDGLQEITRIDGNFVQAYSIVKVGTGQYSWQIKNNFTKYLEGNKDGAIFSDLNGDGKTDIMIPYTVHIGNGGLPPQPIYDYRWNTYLSNGRGLEDKQSSQQFGEYLPRRLNMGSTHMNKYEFYYAKDINRDGLADFIKIKSWNWTPGANDPGDSSYGIEIYENRGLGPDNKISYVKTYDLQPQNNDDCGNCSNWEEPYIPVVGDFRINSDENFLLLTHGPQMLKYTYYDSTERARLESVEQGKLTTEIKYEFLDNRRDANFYTGENTMLYPYTEIERLSQTKVVSRLIQNNIQQDFRYRGLVSNAHGKGMLGFRKTARTNWYAINGTTPKIWTASEMNPLLDGLPIKQWSTKIESELFSASINENNDNLLSYTYTGYLNVNVGLREIRLPNYKLEKDFITKVTKEHYTNYDEVYYLPSAVQTNINQNYSILSTTFNYFHNQNGEGNSYFIGRPRSKVESATINAFGTSDTKTTKEEYNYNGINLESTKKYAQNLTDYIEEVYVYDGWGNITEKTISNSLDNTTQKVRTEYESTGRFVNKKFDNLNIPTEYQYNYLGLQTLEKDVFNNTISKTYDSWGKITSSTSSISGTTIYGYNKYTDGSSMQSVITPDGNETRTYLDLKGQNYKAATKSFEQGKYIAVTTIFDDIGRKIRVSEPYFDTDSSSQWNDTRYDDLSRPVYNELYNGKSFTTVYTDLTVTVNESTGRFKKKTSDPAGNLISSEDNGGIINFTYNSAGQQLKAIYGENIVTTTYDVWGRKKSFHDPSNGTYHYLYDGLGNIKKETSPKGNKQYVYRANGLLESVTEQSDDGTSTNKNYEFTYNQYGQLIQKAGIANSKAYMTQYAYRPEGRLGWTTEYLEGRQFYKWDIQYDTYGRIKRYDQGLISNGITTAVAVENNYSTWDGSLYRIKQENTAKVLWELQETNARGQLKHAKLGEHHITNTYNLLGLVTKVSHASSTKTAINNDYVFNIQKNELNSRYSHTLGFGETFNYDEDNLPLNRLTSWTDPLTGLNHQSDYDVKGRITKNYQVGQITYNTAGSIYRPASMRLNAEGITNYDLNGSSKLLQQITYNENNDPVKITGTQMSYAFEYGLSESRQVMNYNGAFGSVTSRPIAQQITKIYSESGDAEITINKKTGYEKHILYIGGTPYDSDIIYTKSTGETTGSFKFLHKDYLGSILAISDEAGNVVERRHYDAWGRVTHIKDEFGGDLNGFIVLDRGYTSHEHLAGVKLIHMNGRLYDPLLRRFLNADENIQDPENTQIYNKYSYIANNPLMGYDRDGEFIIGVGAAILIGALVGGAAYTLGILVTTGSLRQWSIFDFGKAVIIGGVSGAATFGIGEMFKAGGFLAKLSETAQVFTQAGLHGVSQGFFGMFDGGNFFQGFVSGALGSIGAKGWSSLMGSGGASMIGFGALAGGVGAELSGGNFFKGFMQGGIVAGLNHQLHQITDDPAKRRQQIVKKAKSHKGSTDWAYSKEKGRFGADTNKCNLFVDDILSEAGVYTSDPNGRLAVVGLGTPVTAGQWADANYNIPGWQVVTSPQAGDVVAIAANFTDATGHVGIMISPYESIYAAANNVKISDFGYNIPTHYPHYPGNSGYVYRRYVGLPSFDTAIRNSSFKLFGQ